MESLQLARMVDSGNGILIWAHRLFGWFSEERKGVAGEFENLYFNAIQ